MNYGDVIRDAFYVALRNRFLWVFGFFIGGGSSYVTPSNLGGPPAEPGQEPPTWVFDLFQWVQDNLASFIAVVLLIVVLLIAISTLCRGALAESVAAIDRGELRRFSLSWRAGLSNFWRVLGQFIIFFLLSLALFLALYLLGALVLVGIFAATDLAVAWFLVITLGALFFVPLFIAVSVSLFVVGQFALRDLVVGRTGIFDSIGGGFRLFRENLGRSLLLLLIQIGIALGLLIVLSITTAIVGLILSVPVNLLSPAGPTAAAIIAGVVLSVILSVPFIVLSGAIGTFHHAYWTLAYLRLTSQRPDLVA